jgi:UDP-N-acetylmuramoyl-L-alanyl-D-glutamate--2,6-diaminopimelate ligase
MRLNDLLQRETKSNLEIKGLTADSRNVGPGFLFAALPGTQVDGTHFVEAAISSGASVVLVPSDYDESILAPTDLEVVKSGNVKQTFSRLAARFYGKQPHHLSAVTGTNGKTSIAWFTQALWQKIGHNAASFGTLGAVPAYVTKENIALTTPDTVTLHKALADAVDQNVSHLIFEASSHGLEQHRLDGLSITSAAFTNLSRDHIDYHGSMENYLEAKSRLFSELLPNAGTAVLNADIDQYESLKKHCNRTFSYGFSGSELRLISQKPTAAGQDLGLEIFGQKTNLSIPLIGSFQAMNLICALGIAVAEGGDPSNVLALLPELEGVPGRLEQTATDQNRTKSVVVDYAHTPDALQNAIAALKPHCDGRLIVVFGCGGDRDKGKRPQMGAVAERMADIVIVTDDNPRSEDPLIIRAEALAAAPSALEIGDRRDAIYESMAMAKEGDIVLIAGKGHETGQTVGDLTIPFDDKEVTQAAARTLWQ